MADEPFKGVGMHISSDPETTSITQPGDTAAQKTNRLPLRLLLVSNLTPQADAVDWSSTSHIHRVDKHGFGALMEALAPRLTLEVPNKVSREPASLELDLRFSTLEDFHPVSVARQIPSLAQLVQIRTLVHGVRERSMDMETFRTHLKETGVDPAWAEHLYEALSRPPRPAASRPSATAAGGSGALDRLLGMVSLTEEDDGEAPPPVPTSRASSLVGLLTQAAAGAADTQPKVEKTAADLLITDLDAVLEDQLNEILGAPAFRRLEGGWRGLKFMVDRINFRENIQLDVLPAAKEEIDNALYHQALMPAYNGALERSPLSAVILDFAFDHSKADVDHLDELAATGASLQAPLIGAVDPGFFEVAGHSGLAKLPVLWQHLDGPAYIEWHKLREKKESRFLALTLPAFLLRDAYGAGDPVKTLNFTEKGHLWGQGSLAVAVQIAESFARTGWPTRLLGESNRIENMPIWKSPGGAHCLSVLLPDSKFGEFKKAGFVVLGGKLNRDSLYLARASTVCLAETYEDLMAAAEAREHVTLACQLFVARAAHFVLSLQASMTVGASVAQAMQAVEARMRAFFHTPGQTVPKESVSVQHVADAGLPEHELFAVRLNAPSFILDRPVSLVLGLQLPKGGESEV